MKAVAVAGGSPESPDGPETRETERTEAEVEAAETDPETGGSDAPERVGAEADDVTETGPEETASADRDAQSEAGQEPEAEPAAEAGAGRASEALAQEDPEAGPEPGEPAPEAGEQSEARPDAQDTGRAAPEAEAGEGVAPGVEAEGGDVTGPAAEADGRALPEPEAEAAGGADPQPETEDGTGSEEDVPGAPAAGAEAEGTAPAAGARPEAQTTTGGVDVPEAEPEADGGVEPEPELDDKAEGGDVPETGAAADAEVAPESAAKAGGGDVTGPAAEADGAGQDEDAPDEDAPDEDADESAESGPDGDGDGDEDGDGDGEEGDAGPEARSLPSWARDDETDAERTSQFVALKDPDAPASKTPWPGVVPQDRAPGRAAPAPAAATPIRAAAPVPARPTPPDVVEPTREVPLPPQPPLDLLAELTNTTPPPETPRRTAVRRVKIWTPILLLLAGAATGAQLLRPLPAPQLVAAGEGHTIAGQFSVPWPAKGQGAVRVPGSGDIGSFGEQKPVPTASVAKVMTAYVILKGHPLRKGEAGPQIEIDAKAVADGTSAHESRVEGLVAGTKFSQQDMLKMLMIPSGNNVARLLARWDAGTDSEAAFVAKMNAAAKELGMENTTYTDPSGLDAATVSTAADQLKLAEAVMKDEAFRAVVALPSAEIKGLSTPLINNNTLLSANGLSIRGIKTGSSTPAGGTLMWAAYKSVGDETPLILGTLMDQHADGPDLNGENSLKLVLANSRKIIEAVRQALDSAPVVRKGQTVGHVDDGLGGRTPVVATKDLNVMGVPGQQLKLTLRPGASGTPHAGKAGTEVGVLTVGAGEGAKSVPVALGTPLAEPSFTTRITRIR
ncbi:D-alanyl-D-alanine carboxypeptidase [Streptomyces flavotricini]|uniref:D-alanyl-D-alanine carboxypeptidase n=1 Tax=Streptomyces flavotricini TaxID=66888 RepID=UPI001E3F4A88|nr:serine hydrolase [Streptomyces flavotricini]